MLLPQLFVSDIDFFAYIVYYLSNEHICYCLYLLILFGSKG